MFEFLKCKIYILFFACSEYTKEIQSAEERLGKLHDSKSWHTTNISNQRTRKPEGIFTRLFR